MRLTDAEILAEIERIIQFPYRKWARVYDDPRHKTYLALKILALRLHAESTEGMHAAIQDLGAKIDGMNRSRNEAGEFSETSMRAVALEVRAKWHSIKTAFKIHGESAYDKTDEGALCFHSKAMAGKPCR